MIKYAVKGLTAWDTVHTGLFNTRKEAENWLRDEMNRQRLWKSESHFKEFAEIVIYEV